MVNSEDSDNIDLCNGHMLTSDDGYDPNKQNRIEDYVNDTLQEGYKMPKNVIDDVSPPVTVTTKLSHTPNFHNHPCQNERNNYNTCCGEYNCLVFRETYDDTDTEDEDSQSIHYVGCEHVTSPVQCTK